MDATLDTLWRLDGRALFLWAAWGIGLLALTLDALLARRRHRRALAAPDSTWNSTEDDR
ncbi:hypothetical protein [Pseudaquabacterium rugosum]|uniref:Heme exporter protein D n=1 Tax=Pseudaquabacterium rugosum TaxID=2984194 RepID=A0ABU9BEZ7_9BURK